MKKLFFLLLILSLTLFGCATVPQGTAPSASPLISQDGKAKSYEVVGKAEGSAGHFTLFGFIPFGRTNINAAVQDAVFHYQGDNLINVHYYVNRAWYLIGSSTSITVKGDVIKYTLAGGSSKPISTLGNIFPSGPSGLSHRLAIGSAMDGLSADYTLSQPFANYLLFSFSLGYKEYNKTETIGYGHRTTEYSALPVTLNFGASVKRAFSIPLNPYISAGVAYIPIYFSSVERFEWNQVGFNINAGLDYEIIKGVALGVDYRYFKSLNDLESSPSYGFFSGSDQKAVKFSNLSLGLTFYP